MDINLALQYGFCILALAVVLWGLGVLKLRLLRLSARLSEKALKIRIAKALAVDYYNNVNDC